MGLGGGGDGVGQGAEVEGDPFFAGDEQGAGVALQIEFAPRSAYRAASH